MNDFFPRTTEGMREWLQTFKSPNDFIIAFRKATGWTLALIRTGDNFVRFQLQSEPPESEDCGEIHCITGKDFPDTTLKALEFCKPKAKENGKGGGV